jgi:hypothetical protein
MKTTEDLKIKIEEILIKKNHLESLIKIEIEKIINAKAPEVWSIGTHEISNSKDYIKFLSKEIDVLNGQISIIEWVLTNKSDY